MTEISYPILVFKSDPGTKLLSKDFREHSCSRLIAYICMYVLGSKRDMVQRVSSSLGRIQTTNGQSIALFSRYIKYKTWDDEKYTNTYSREASDSVP